MRRTALTISACALGLGLACAEDPSDQTGGDGAVRPGAADAAAGGSGGHGGSGGNNGSGGGGGSGGVDAARPDAAPDSKNPGPDTHAPPDNAVQEIDAARPDTGAKDTKPVDTPVSMSDPEPGRLAGITRLHNAVRAEIPVPDLTWDAQLAATAQAYADKCVYQHSGAPNLGENIAAFSPSGGAVGPVVDLWAGEKAFYDYANNSCAAGKQCGHYTQIVWKSTKLLGCGVTACSAASSPFQNNRTWDFWVCNFSPPGNYVGQRPY